MPYKQWLSRERKTSFYTLRCSRTMASRKVAGGYRIYTQGGCVMQELSVPLRRVAAILQQPVVPLQ